MKEKEGERRALLSCVGWPFSFGFLTFEHGVPVERGCPFLSFVPPCSVFFVFCVMFNVLVARADGI